jgi:hypothetical protein
MGEMADDEILHQMCEWEQWHLAGGEGRDEAAYQKERKALADARIWVGGDGKRTPYKDLGRGHFLNILMFVRRKTMDDIKEETQEEDVQVDLRDAWANNKPVEWEGLMEEARNRGGMVSIAARHIDNGMAEMLLRENVM